MKMPKKKNVLSEKRRKEIEKKLLAGIKQKDIANEYDLTRGRICQINRELRDRIKQAERSNKPYYIEYSDHAHGEIDDIKVIPILCCLGILQKETDEAILVKTLWSKTTGEIFQSSLIMKKNLKAFEPLEKKKDIKESLEK